MQPYVEEVSRRKAHKDFEPRQISPKLQFKGAKVRYSTSPTAEVSFIRVHDDAMENLQV